MSIRHPCPAPTVLGGGGPCPFAEPCGRHCRTLLEERGLDGDEIERLAAEPCPCHTSVQEGQS